MTELFNRLDFYISLIGVGLVIYLWVRRWLRRFTMSPRPPVRSVRAPLYVPDTIAPEPPPPHQSVPPLYQFENRAEPGIDLVAVRAADRLTVIDVLAVLNLNGEYLYSANQIAEKIGGTRSEVLARIAIHRPKPPAKKIEAHLDRPANGWGKG